MYSMTALLVIAALSSGRASTAPRTASANLTGTYVLDQSKSDDPSHAVGDATGSMGRFKRNAIRKRMGDALKPADTLRVAAAGDTISLATSGRMHFATVPGAAPKARTGEKGVTVQLASAWAGDTLVLTLTSDKFQREARYSLDNGGSGMRVAITMGGGQLASPIHYVLEYKRVAGAPSPS
jgi:hypothetical protein